MENKTGHKIFLLDAIGAATSLLFLFLICTFNEVFGMPKSVLKIFMCIAATLCIYSSFIYFLRPANWTFHLKTIAIFNFSYCLFTLYQLQQNFDKLTLLGIIYFVAEILVILLLAAYELHIARRATYKS